MNKEHNNITNIYEYRENMMSDASALNINSPQQGMPNMPSNLTGGVPYTDYTDYTANYVEEFVSEEFVNSYLQVTSENTPDLWSRIEAGFEEEAKDIIVQQKQRSRRTVKVVGFVAAAAVITIIAVPVMLFGSGEEKNGKGMYSTTVADNEIHYDEASDSVVKEAPVQGDMSYAEDEMMAESATEATAQAPIHEDSVSNNQMSTDGQLENQLKDINGVQTDARQLTIVVEFDFSNQDQVAIEIKSDINSEYTEFDINIGDKIIISNPLFVQVMDVMIYKAEITLDSVTIDKTGNITGRIIDLVHLWEY